MRVQKLHQKEGMKLKTFACMKGKTKRQGREKYRSLLIFAILCVCTNQNKMQARRKPTMNEESKKASDDERNQKPPTSGNVRPGQKLLSTVLITATALFCHVQRIYPIGAGGDAWLDYYQPNFTSVCFVLGVSLLLSSKELWPSALRRPSQPIMFCYLALVSAFTVSVTLRTVWLPLTLSIAKSNFWLARKIKTTKSLKKMWLLGMAKVLESQSLQNLEVALVAIVFLHYSLKASGIYNELLQTNYSKAGKRCSGKATSGDFSPQVSDSFISFAVRKKR